MKPWAIWVSLGNIPWSLYNFLVLYIIIRKRVQYRMARKTMRDIIRSLIAGIILVILIYSTRQFFTESLPNTYHKHRHTLIVYGLFFVNITFCS
jgi:peptidoglycan biosynthesis protein MviN/MurJ (putative lipid II flippase)